MDARQARHRAIETILSAQPVQSQEVLQGELGKLGLRATQATLSRDLRELGVLKGPTGYVLPGHANLPKSTRATIGKASVERVVQRYVRSVKLGVGQIVCRTDPGYAQLVALEFDRFPPPGVIGTVAGDDTIFIAADSPTALHDLFVVLTETMIGAGGER